MRTNPITTTGVFAPASNQYSPRVSPLSAAYDNLLVAIHNVTRRRLDAIVPLVYQAQLQGQISEDDATRLHEAAELRRGVFAARQRVHNHKKAMGPRPEKPQHPRSRWRDNRRMWSGSGPLPPTLRHLFTAGENAVAAIIRAEVRQNGACKLPYSAIAKSAGLLSTTVVKRFVRIAKAKGLIAVEERKVAHNRNAPNIITITSREWLQWIEGATAPKARKGGGGISVSPKLNQDINTSMRNPQSQEAAGLGSLLNGSNGLMREGERGDAWRRWKEQRALAATTPKTTANGPFGAVRQFPKG